MTAKSGWAVDAAAILSIWLGCCLLLALAGACDVHLITLDLGGRRVDAQSPKATEPPAEPAESDQQSPDEIMKESIDVLVEETVSGLAKP